LSITQDGHIRERNLNVTGRALFPISIAGVVQQNPSHDLCCDRKEVGTVLPPSLLLIDQPQVRLIYESSSLEGVIRILPAHVTMGKAMQFVFNDRKEPIER
jgi:hypothetical protein